MATIKAAIALYDGVTSPLQSMTRAMNVVLSSFERMQTASGQAVDTRAIQEARQELEKVKTTFQDIEDSIVSVGAAQENLNGSAKKDGGMWSKIKTAAAPIGNLIGEVDVLGIADQLANTRAKLNLLVDDGGSVVALEQNIMASAQRSRSAYFDTAAAVSTLGLNAGAVFGNDMNQVVDFMEQVNKQFVIGGATAQEQSNAMTQLTQAMGSGSLQGEELNAVLNSAPGIASAIAQYMGIAEGTVRNVASQGLVTAEVVKNAMFAAAEETNAKFESMPMTWAQIWETMKTQALSIFAPILTKINEIGNSAQFAQATTGLMNGLAGIAQVAAVVFDLLIGMASAVVDNWSWLGPIFLGVAGALSVYYGAKLASNAAETISSGLHILMAGATMIHLAATGKLTAATAAETATQFGLNAAMTACPIVWIVIGIIAIIAALFAASAAIAKFTGAASSGFGIICGGVMVVIAFFKNLGLSVANIGLGIWEVLKACANNMGAAFHNVITDVQSWFFNLLSTALTVVEGICAALNKLPFVEFDYSGVTDKAKEFADKSAALAADKRDYTFMGDAFLKGASTFDVFQEGWAKNAFASGAAWGDGVSDKLSNFFKFDSLDNLDPMGSFDSLGAGDDAFTNLGNKLDGVYGNTGNTAENTAAMKDSLEIGNEELSLLRDIAEREAINRFTTAEIKVEMVNNNAISTEMDLDGIVSSLETKVTQALLSSAEGVHV